MTKIQKCESKINETLFDCLKDEWNLEKGIFINKYRKKYLCFN